MELERPKSSLSVDVLVLIQVDPEMVVLVYMCVHLKAPQVITVCSQNTPSAVDHRQLRHPLGQLLSISSSSALTLARRPQWHQFLAVPCWSHLILACLLLAPFPTDPSSFNTCSGALLSPPHWHHSTQGHLCHCCWPGSGSGLQDWLPPDNISSQGKNLGHSLGVPSTHVVLTDSWYPMSTEGKLGGL